MNFSDVVIFLKASAEKEKDNYKQMLAVAWKQALWTRCDPKKFPELQEVFDEIDKLEDKVKGVPQTPMQMFDVVKALHAKFGGA
jgi:hypothetical protein